MSNKPDEISQDEKGISAPDPIMTAADVAKYLHLDRKTVYEYSRQGTIPHIKIGRLLRFSRETIDRFVTGQLPPRITQAQVNEQYQRNKQRK